MSRLGLENGTEKAVCCRYDAQTGIMQTVTRETLPALIQAAAAEYGEPVQFCLAAWETVLPAELSAAQVQRVGTPEAAAAYFFWERQQAGTPYTGRVLTVDCGAEGVRAALCEVQADGSIRRLADGGTERNCGGTAFCERLVQRLCGTEEPALCRELADCLREQADDIQELMQDYTVSPEDFSEEEQTALFLHPAGGGEIPVSCAAILAAFQETAGAALQRIIKTLKASPAYTADPKNIRILMTGGFSRFCCTQDCIRALFGTRTGARDDRFPPSGCYDMAVRGAALIAAGAVCITSGSPQEIGLLAAERTENGVREYEIPLIAAGAARAAYAEPVYSEIPVRVLEDTPQEIVLYIRSAGERQTFPAEIPPCGGTGDRLIRLGLALNGVGKPVLYAKTADGQTQLLGEPAVMQAGGKG